MLGDGGVVVCHMSFFVLLCYLSFTSLTLGGVVVCVVCVVVFHVSMLFACVV